MSPAMPMLIIKVSISLLSKVRGLVLIPDLLPETPTERHVCIFSYVLH